jgi:hypothetical protein
VPTWIFGTTEGLGTTGFTLLILKILLKLSGCVQKIAVTAVYLATSRIFIGDL